MLHLEAPESGMYMYVKHGYEQDGLIGDILKAGRQGVDLVSSQQILHVSHTLMPCLCKMEHGPYESSLHAYARAWQEDMPTAAKSEAMNAACKQPISET